MSEVKRWTQPCVQQQGEGFLVTEGIFGNIKVLEALGHHYGWREVPLFEDSKGKYVLASDFERIEAELERAKRHIWRSGASESFNRIAELEAHLARLASDKARLEMEVKELAQRVVTLEKAP